MDNVNRHAVIVLAHDDFDSLVRLINSFDADFDFFIHIDRESVLAAQSNKALRQFDSERVRLYSWRHVKWGSCDIIKTQMRLVKKALGKADYSYIHLMSGHDIVLVHCEVVKSFFNENMGYEFMNCRQLPVEEWEHGTFDRFSYYGLYDILDYNSTRHREIIEKFIKIQKYLNISRRIPGHYPKLYGGSNWVSLTSACWRHVLSNYKRSFLRRLKFTFGSDEVFYHTVVMNSPFAPKVTCNNLRLTCWNKGGAAKILTKYDWWNICKSDALFARKANSGASDELVDWIEESKGYQLSADADILSKQDPMRRLDKSRANILEFMARHLKLKTACEFLCGNAVYVRYLRDCGIDAQGFDISKDTSRITRRLFPSGFYCECAPLYEPMCMDEAVDFVYVLEEWVTGMVQLDLTFLKNIIRCSQKFILIRTDKYESNRCLHSFGIEKIDEIMEKSGFRRSVAFSLAVESFLRGKSEGGAYLFYER